MTNEEFQRIVLEKLTNMQEALLLVKGQGSENSEFISALMHRTEEMTAQLHNLSSDIDQLSGRVANVEKDMATRAIVLETERRLLSRVDHVGSDVSFLVRKIADHDDEIRALRAVK